MFSEFRAEMHLALATQTKRIIIWMAGICAALVSATAYLVAK